MRIDGATSHIGIGTDSPTTLLHIKSSGTGEPKITIENTNDDSQEAQLEFKKNGTSPANSDDLGIIRFVGDDSNGSAHLYSYIMVDSETVTAGAENGRIFFFNSKAGTTHEVIGISHDEIVINEAGVDTNFRIEGDGDANLFFVDAGNDRVGIGTNSPDVDLDVKKSTTTIARVASTGSHANLRFGRASSSYDAAILFYDNMGSTPSLQWRIQMTNGGTDLSIRDEDGSPDGQEIMKFKDGGGVDINADVAIASGHDLTVDTNTLHVDATNNRVGIGTTTPSQELDVSGDIRLSGEIEINGDLNHDGSNVGFFGTAVASRQNVGNGSFVTNPVNFGRPPAEPAAFPGFEPNVDSYIANLENEIVTISSKLNDLIDALQLYGLIL